MEQEFTYDLFVIGGGSGGLSCARKAAKLGVKVGLADFVKPSPIGSKWGLGGTCVNVGCIPKKLMHYCGLLGDNLNDMRESGWKIPENISHNWEVLVERVQLHIKSLNFGYRKSLKTDKVTYHNRLASLIDSHTIQLLDSEGKKETVTAQTIVIAVGGRPNYPENLEPYKSLVITSDDIFSLSSPPGKTLVVGASYIALECAGFLSAIGFDTTVMVRSILLRGFDQQMANRILDYMKEHKTKFLHECIPVKIEALPDGKKKVYYENNHVSYTDIYDTVMLAVGRSPDVKNIGLEKLGIKLDKSGKVITNDFDQTNIENIFCIGDCALGRPELTPSAIMAGKLLAQRIFAGSQKKMDYINIATTVFTPLEYGCVGYAEEHAIEKFGEKSISVYHTTFKPLEWNFYSERMSDICYVKMIVKKDDNKVIGIHYLGPNAGEVIQGYAVAVKMGATKKDFDKTVGIHPTCAEELVDLTETKEDNPDATKTGC